MALLDLLKRELGTRNVAKYYANGEGNTVGDETLQGYLAEGLEKLAEYKPMPVSADATMSGALVLAVPANIWKPTAIFFQNRYLAEAKSYEVYPGDRLWDDQIVERLVLNENAEYPDHRETQLYGEWLFDSKRKVIQFVEGLTGPVKLFGYGIPAESALTEGEKRDVLRYALGTALVNITPTLMAKMDIQMEGINVKQKTAEYAAEGQRLIREFEQNRHVPYISSGR